MVMMKRKIPSLVGLCIQTAIDNLRYIGDVGELETHLLQEILPHCTIDQLMHIEKSTEGRDLSLVTDDLWKRFYEQHFGVESANLVIRRMKQKGVVFKWKQLFEAKTKEREEFQNKSVEKLKQRYEEETVKKQRRQIQLCSKVPPASAKRFFSSGSSSYNLSNCKGNLMKKAKMEYLNSHEARVHAAMRKNSLQRNSFTSQSVSRSSKPGNFLGKGAAPPPASSSKQSKPLRRGL